MPAINGPIVRAIEATVCAIPLILPRVFTSWTELLINRNTHVKQIHAQEVRSVIQNKHQVNAEREYPECMKIPLIGTRRNVNEEIKQEVLKRRRIPNLWHSGGKTKN
mmetsp:Transcript_10532/g.19012  ORF Transcript_10532/g.19012 Transcript_10532/m.19012 type:complete len:107 (-) Transcript_10532:519-839(-)